MKLLYRTAEWHGLAKLRMHTDSSLALLESLTTEFASLMQNFQELTTSQFLTIVLPQERDAQQRREVNNQPSRSSQITALQPLPLTVDCPPTGSVSQSNAIQPAVDHSPTSSVSQSIAAQPAVVDYSPTGSITQSTAVQPAVVDQSPTSPATQRAAGTPAVIDRTPTGSAENTTAVAPIANLGRE